MPRFFINDDEIYERGSNSEIILTGDKRSHIANVLRHKPGDILSVNASRRNFRAKIVSITAESVTLSIIAEERLTEPRVKLTLFQALPKKDKMELIIQKAVELGVYEIVPVLSSRVNAFIDDYNKEAKLNERWNKIAESAAEQSGRDIIPRVSRVKKFGDAVEYSKTLSAAVIPYENETERTLKDFLRALQTNLNNSADVFSLGIFIGPEGGFTVDEILLTGQHNITPVTLGERVLRTETAAISTIANVMYELN